MNQLTALTSITPHAMISSDVHGSVVAWNPAAERMFEYSAHEMLGQSVELLVPARLIDTYRMSVMTRARENELGAPMMLTAMKRGGDEFLAEVAISKWSKAGRQFFTAIVTDKSACRQTEQRLDQLFSMVTHLLEGKVLDGRYQLDRLVRKDGHGCFYDALDLEQRVLVTVRIVRALTGSGTSELKGQYPHMPEIHDLGWTEPGLVYSVMEPFSGESLAERVLRGKAIDPRRAVSWGKCLAESLMAAHEKRDVHGFLSADSVFLEDTRDPRGLLKVLDFELGRLVADEAPRALLANLVSGAFSAPERRSGRSPTPASDVYSFALVLGTLFSTTMPPNSDCEVQTRDWLLAALPRPFAALVPRALSFDEQRRPTLLELWLALDASASSESQK